MSDHAKFIITPKIEAEIADLIANAPDLTPEQQKTQDVIRKALDQIPVTDEPERPE